MHLMGRLGERLVQQEIISNEDLEKLRLAALLHDIGHFPYSHNLEEPISNDYQNFLSNNPDEMIDPLIKGRHEDFSYHLITNSGLKDHFSTFSPVDVGSLLQKRYDKPVYSLLISSDLDVDRMDYLLRDAHETGVSYGQIDIDRLIQTITFVKDENDNYTNLAVEAKGKQALESFLLSRYHMYQTVYTHKTASGFSALLEKIYSELLTQKKVYDYNHIIKMTDGEVYNFNDHYMWHIFEKNQKNKKLNPFIECFKYRKRLIMTRDLEAITSSGTITNDYANLSKIENPLILKYISRKSKVPIDWIFYVKPKQLAILSDPEGEKAVHLLKKDKTSNPIASEENSIISMLYNKGYFSARVYTLDQYYSQLDQVIRNELKV